ncbi:MAG: deoxyribodipyrimidine photo-lyase [Nocardioidaceae bacterium]|nr:deoxyribodipyrimidine photo-lyase [Nocardioidaceae bacterium]
MWFRRDLRLADSPALRAAVDGATAGVVPLFVLDPALWGPAGPNRRAYLAASLSDLGKRIGGWQLRCGDPVKEVVSVARAAEASTVHIAADFGPYGRERDKQVQRALAEHGIDLVRTGSPYAVAPGRVTKPDGSPYAVYTPFWRAWTDHGWRAPVAAPQSVDWIRPLTSVDLPAGEPAAGTALPPAGEQAARRRWRDFLDDGVNSYGEDRDRPDRDRTSRMSVHLKWGEIHPRTMLADLARRRGDSVRTYRQELAWREFYADVLWQRPDSARGYLRPQFAAMRYARAGSQLETWAAGRTGFPIVDAGMRQLRSEGWMHNRLRMIVASFLVKDLHVEWQHGAQHFLHWLVDGDLSSNNHGWQWVAGSGTDASPYFRVFNPVSQGKKFDPGGDYVRRHVEELAGVAGGAVHEPWTLPGGVPNGYPEPMVDHKAERVEALARYDEVKGS